MSKALNQQVASWNNAPEIWPVYLEERDYSSAREAQCANLELKHGSLIFVCGIIFIVKKYRERKNTYIENLLACNELTEW